MKIKSPINSHSHRNFGRITFIPFVLILLGAFVQGFAQTKVDVEAFIQSAAKLETEDLGEGLVSKTYLSEKGVSLNAWVDQEGKAVPRIRGAAYNYVVPGPKGFFLRTAWLSEDGTVLKEERRNYDEKGRLVVEGLINPETGVFSEEYRHRYSEDGKTQYTTRFVAGIQQGPESSRLLEEN